MAAIISYKTNTQKKANGFKSILTPGILRDICVRLIGQTHYIVHEITDKYNKGRLLTVKYGDMTHYVTVSEQKIDGRNSSLQSVSTALNQYYADPDNNKQLWYYFVPYAGNPFTDYHLVYYRLMLTAGIGFLNIDSYYSGSLSPFSSVDEIITERSENRNSNRSNNSSFVTKTQERVQLYAKTYGANKYESTVFGVALSKITDRPIDVFSVSEQNLKTLPRPSINTFNQLGNITVYNTSLHLNRQITDSDDPHRLRSAAYCFNLLDRIGIKRCALCSCEIPEIIHGAHIWSVADIRKCSTINDSQKYAHAINAHNGLWLCQNHHKLFDSNFLAFDSEGRCLIKRDIPQRNESFIRNSVNVTMLGNQIISDEFKYYLSLRNTVIDLSRYQSI